MIELIDTHAHIDAAEFDCDREEILRRAESSGVNTIVIPGVERAAFEKVLEICKKHPFCYPALGIHPMYVEKADPGDLEDLRSFAGKYKLSAIGEIGLDFFVENYDREKQIYYFEAQLKIAKEFDLPVLLHLRRAQDAVLSSLRRIRVKGGIAHAFNGSFQQAEEFVKLGFKLGFGGAMTYDRALKLRRLAKDLPISSIVLETDSPDMPPSFIGKERNCPEYLPKIAEIFAELRGISLDAAALATSMNAKEILELS